MSIQRPKFTYSRTLSPFPEGWYYVGSRKQILKSRLMHKTWMGEDIVVWSDDDGRVCVADAYCPHLGAFLGPDAGGQVCDGRLVCPFHGFEFDAGGQCVATPYAEPPKTAKLKLYPTQDVNGLIFAWWGIDGRNPQWHLPDEKLDSVGWTDYTIRTFSFPSHPQDTTENVVDLAHLRYVHGYHNVERVGKATMDGPILRSHFKFTRSVEFARPLAISLNVTVNTFVYGLGFSYVEIRETSIGMDMRFWVLATPVDGALIDMILVSQSREIRNPKRKIAGLAFLPVSMRAPLMKWFVAKMQDRDVIQDIKIWSRKRYVSRPALCRSDGEIMPFRAYCAQFYPKQNESSQTGTVVKTEPIEISNLPTC